MPKKSDGKNFPTSVVLPFDLKTTIKRACKQQGCSMVFKINQILREWEKGFYEREKEFGRGQTE
jgi:hypothetical protein